MRQPMCGKLQIHRYTRPRGPTPTHSNLVCRSGLPAMRCNDSLRGDLPPATPKSLSPPPVLPTVSLSLFFSVFSPLSLHHLSLTVCFSISISLSLLISLFPCLSSISLFLSLAHFHIHIQTVMGSRHFLAIPFQP